ncbi:DNA polymerase III subunit beta [Aquibaculum arenosum]|uniref:Beta sliding clamp n=1 Tax=Aquibaculum arenosum TaxID=3032591 RepID=A0ABT5YK14_9PROT|nr:DNA polymerase III subunit beta [Fodinicurvata sp. CAU 1616]MDF2095234.1 DNA polymerase III subunit beta [Fodinicurvata sp. CAU 1616]
MKLTIERAALLRSLAHVQSVVERRNTIPVLSNVLLEASEGQLGLTATDMDLTIHETTPAMVQEAGATTVPAHTFYDIIRKLPDGSEVELALDGEKGQVRLRAGRSNFSLSTLPREDFPSTASVELPCRFTLQAGEAINLIDRTRFAISTEETRYYLNGIYLHAGTSNGVDVLRAVATDGHRLARFEMALPEGAGEMPGVIVPRKTVNELRKLIDEVEGGVEVALSETRVRFTFGSVELASKLIDGTFPDYERVIPSGNDKVMSVDCRSFASAVDRVSTISTEKSRAVKLALRDSALVLSATAPDAGSAEEEVPVHYEGPPLEIGFNSRYLLDIAQQIEGEGAEFTMADGASPTIVRDAADPSALYVLMPMRV